MTKRKRMVKAFLKRKKQKEWQKKNLYLPQRIEWLFKWLFQEVPVKEKGMVSSVPRKKKHKGKIKENFYLLF